MIDSTIVRGQQFGLPLSSPIRYVYLRTSDVSAKQSVPTILSVSISNGTTITFWVLQWSQVNHYTMLSLSNSSTYAMTSRISSVMPAVSNLIVWIAYWRMPRQWLVASIVFMIIVNITSDFIVTCLRHYRKAKWRKPALFFA